MSKIPIKKYTLDEICSDIELFGKFVKRNRSNFDGELKEHPPNRENINKWVEMHKSTDLYTYAKSIANNITYATYNDLQKKLSDIANELFLLQKSTGIKPYLYVYDNTQKSNFVMTLLFYYLCIWKNIQFAGIITYAGASDKFVVIVDDATYSGTQICGHIIALGCDNTKIFLAIPYISETAEASIREQVGSDSELIIPSDSMRFRDIYSIHKTYTDTFGATDTGVVSQRIGSAHLLYFNFKLPDYLSIPENIFKYGYRLDRDEYEDGDEPLCFVTGCEDGDKKIECPKPFYKNNYWLYTL
jgi:hypothetical protein